MATILELAQIAVQAARKAGAEWADAYCSIVRHADAAMDNSSVLDCHMIRDYGLGVRAFYKGGLGAATVQSLEPKEAARCGEEAAILAHLAHPDPDFVALPEPSEVLEEVPGLFDEKIAGLPAESVVQWCRQAITEAQAIAPQARVSGGAGISVGEAALASSTGVALMQRGTLAEISVEVTIPNGEEAGFSFEFDVARRLEDFVPEGLGTRACEQALRFLGARPVETKRMTLVLSPLAVEELIRALLEAASAEHIQRGRSFLKDKEGASIAAEYLSVKEAPLWPGGIFSSAYDGEGVAKQELMLIQRGILTTYLHNSYTAHKAGVPNNAHATRDGYGASVGIGVSNVQIVPGDKTEAELIREVRDGLYVHYASLAPDLASGEISATIDFGFRIRNGELAYPVKMAMIGSEIFAFLQAIDAVSSDYRQEPGLMIPCLRVQDVQVAGAL